MIGRQVAKLILAHLSDKMDLRAGFTGRRRLIRPLATGPKAAGERQ